MQHNRTPYPQQPDHAGLEFIDHGGLEVVDRADAPEVLPAYPNHTTNNNSNNNITPVYGYPPGHGPANAYWDQRSASGNTYSASSPPSSFAYPPLLANSSGGKADCGLKEAATRSQPPPKRLVCGIKKSLCLILVAIAGFLLVLATALGVGLGLGLRPPSSASTPASPATSSTSSRTAAPSRTTYPTPRATVTIEPNLAIGCPANNETLYQSQEGGNRKFLLLCDRDYSGSTDNAVDLFNTVTYTFSECIDKCAANAACKAVGWGTYNGKPTCWLKSEISKPHPAAGWYFAVGEEILRSASQRKRSQL
ncbi:hypothetical protein RB595_000646 [Gaeumannomyces hyphopodioides]